MSSDTSGGIGDEVSAGNTVDINVLESNACPQVK